MVGAEHSRPRRGRAPTGLPHPMGWARTLSLRLAARRTKWPDYRTIFVRLLLVGILLGCVAAAILTTYFLTRKYDCR
jgi:hypothetical protein